MVNEPSPRLIPLLRQAYSAFKVKSTQVPPCRTEHLTSSLRYQKRKSGSEISYLTPVISIRDMTVVYSPVPVA